MVEVPVVYDGEDLDDVAELLGCDRDEVVRRHTAALWTVAFCGFAPGFGYLTGRRRRWTAAPDEPAHQVPAGSVALAGEFTGVYPRESPGGWQLIGRTDARRLRPRPRPARAARAPARRVRFVEVGAR